MIQSIDCLVGAMASIGLLHVRTCNEFVKIIEQSEWEKLVSPINGWPLCLFQTWLPARPDAGVNDVDIRLC